MNNHGQGLGWAADLGGLMILSAAVYVWLLVA